MNVIPNAIVHSMKETLMPNVTYNDNAILKTKTSDDDGTKEEK